jgi:hypothetical protein
MLSRDLADLGLPLSLAGTGPRLRPGLGAFGTGRSIRPPRHKIDPLLDQAHKLLVDRYSPGQTPKSSPGPAVRVISPPLVRRNLAQSSIDAKLSITEAPMLISGSGNGISASFEFPVD